MYMKVFPMMAVCINKDEDTWIYLTRTPSQSMQINLTDGKIDIKVQYLTKYIHMMNICVEFSMKTIYKTWRRNQKFT